ncbi:MAG: hypothetical protein COV60_00435, partial [Candidatus Magasanikbacteria bacterium CG11_big_fil_rev_8_21_14_0_20_43_7]
MPLSITDIIVQSIALYKQHTTRFISYAILLFVPGACMTISSAIIPILISDTLMVGFMGLSYLVYVCIALILSLIGFWFSITFIRVIARLHANEPVGTMVSELHASKKIFWSAIGVAILFSLSVFGGTILLIIPGIIFGLWFAFSHYYAIIEETPVISSMKASKALVNGRWWMVFWRLVLPTFLFTIGILCITYVIRLPLIYILSHTNVTSVLFVTWGVIAQLILSLVSAL